LHCLDSD
jgi:hypothetical protein